MRALVATFVLLVCLSAAAIAVLSPKHGLEGEPSLTIAIEVPKGQGASLSSSGAQAGAQAQKKPAGSISLSEAAAGPKPANNAGGQTAGGQANAPAASSDQQAAGNKVPQPKQVESLSSAAILEMMNASEEAAGSSN
jgi:hypothetical protein